MCEKPELGTMSATEVKINNNNLVIHNDPLNHMEVVWVKIP